MKKWFYLFCVVIFVPFGFAHAEEITAYDIAVTVHKDATMHVKETITYDFGSQRRHGIYRDIPVQYVIKGEGMHYTKIDDVTVTDAQGNPYKHKISYTGNNMRIKIGNKHKKITGQHVYVIDYTVHNAMRYFDTHDELYWNVVGHDWEVPIHNITTHITAPAIEKTTCYFGPDGSYEKCRASAHENGVATTFTHDALNPHENVTIVVGLKRGTVYKPTKQEEWIRTLKETWGMYVLFLVLGGMFLLWFFAGRDPKGKGVIIPRYTPPRNLDVLEVGILRKQRLKGKHVTAAIIQLAVDGYLVIKKEKDPKKPKKTRWALERTKKIPASFAPSERMIYDAIFKNRDRCTMEDLQKDFYKQFSDIEDSVSDALVRKKLYESNPSSVHTMYGCFIVLVFLPIIVIFLIFGKNGPFMDNVGVLLFFIPLIVILFSRIMPRATKKGAIIREELDGFKLYLKKAEKDRINFHNAPERTPEHFEKMLPYAIVFGVEKQWAKYFADIYQGNPQWYAGGQSVYSADIISSSLHDFSQSGASGFSSSGGGAGGGGGGGGGGSW